MNWTRLRKNLSNKARHPAVIGTLGAVAIVPIAALVQCARAPNPAYAYNFKAWLVWDRGWRGRMSRAQLSYPGHVVNRLHLAGQLLVAGLVGYVHAAFAGLVPFVAEECGTQLHALVTARRARGGRADHAAEGTPYAYQPRKWIYAIDGKAHVSFSGGTWGNHARFACWASGQFLIGAWCGVVHAVFPPLFPTVAEEVSSRQCPPSTADWFVPSFASVVAVSSSSPLAVNAHRMHAPKPAPLTVESRACCQHLFKEALATSKGGAWDLLLT